MNFHVVSLPHTQTTKDYVTCAYTEKVRKFCTMMKQRGHTVYLYAGDENEAECDELIVCMTRAEQEGYGFTGPADNLKVKFDLNEKYWQEMNSRAVHAIKQRKQPHDFLCLIGGTCQKPIADELPDMMAVEYGIGYSGTFAKYRVFESYAWMHTVYGAQMGADTANGHFYDAVIPNYYEISDFPFSREKEDYYLFIGRLTDRKGFQIAADVCERLGKRLLIAGQGKPPTYGDYVGPVNVKDRGLLMSKATAVFVPTLYLEPFGGVSVEAMLCGTPVITTDWGAFSENVEQGVTGFRCRTFAEFLKAAEDVKQLEPYQIQAFAINRFSTKVLAVKYEEYFERLLSLYGEGWYATA